MTAPKVLPIDVVDGMVAWIKSRANHAIYCKAIKGPPDESWLIEEECTCGLTDLKRKLGIRLLGE